MTNLKNEPLRVLYVSRNHQRNTKRQSRLQKTINSLMSTFWSHRADRNLIGQQGFFEASLFGACHVVSRQIDWVLRNHHRIEAQFDAVVVNSKYSKPRRKYQDLEWLSSVNPPRILFFTQAKARELPPDHILDEFDLVYKRECLRNLNEYDISEENKSKLRTTMLTCPLVEIDRRDVGKAPQLPRPRLPDDPYIHDVFFSGQLRTNPIRGEILRKLESSGIRIFGGGQTNPNEIEHSSFKQMDRHTAYANAIRQSKINIAPEGIGEFTHRHLEILCLGGFCLSTPSIRDVTIPLAEMEDGVHYVAFDDMDDMIKKIEYYLEHDQERERIAEAGRRLFETVYDPVRHGDDIRREIELLLTRKNIQTNQSR